MTTKSENNAHARSFVRCASVVAEHVVREDSVSPITSTAICESTTTGLADEEGTTVSNTVSRDTDLTRPLYNSVSQSPSGVPSLARTKMAVTRRRINQIQFQGPPNKSNLSHNNHQLYVN